MGKNVVRNFIISLLTIVAVSIFRQMVNGDMIFTIASGVILFVILMAFSIFGDSGGGQK